MSNNEEVRRILKMVADGKISVDEADELMAAIQEGSQEEAAQDAQSNPADSFSQNALDFNPHLGTKFKGKARWFRVQVTDTTTGQTNTNVRLPVGFGNIGLGRILKGLDIGLKGPEFDAIAQNIDSIDGPTMILDVLDGDEHVKIFLE